MARRREAFRPLSAAPLSIPPHELGVERQQLLASLIEDAPDEVLRVALPAALRASLPPAVQALEGGRVLLILIEILRGGKRLKPEREGIINFVGISILLTLMVVITVSDVLHWGG